MRWRRSVPRLAILTPDVETNCLTQELGFGRPLSVPPENITIGEVTVLAAGPGEHEVTVNFEFSYNHGTRGVPTEFILWLDDVPAPEVMESQDEVRIGGMQRNGTIEQSFMTLNDSFNYYFQVCGLLQCTDSQHISWGKEILIDEWVAQYDFPCETWVRYLDNNHRSAVPHC